MDGINFRAGLRFGLLLAATNLIYQSLVWFTGLNRFEAPLYLFFLFPPIALYLAFARASAGRNLSAAMVASIAILVAVTASALLIPTMLLFLDLLGGGALPPVLQSRLASLQADTSGSAEIAERIRRLEQLTSLQFAINAAIGTAILTLLAALPAALALHFRRARGGRGS